MSSNGSPSSTSGSPAGGKRQSFWPSKRLKLDVTRDETSDKVQLAVNYEKLSDVPVGKHFGKFLKFRVSFVSRNKTGMMILRGVDESGERIIKAFSDAKAILDKMKLGKVYTLKSFSVAEKFFGDEHEIVVLKSSVVTEEADDNFGKIPFRRTLLRELENSADGSVHDVIGFICAIDPKKILPSGDKTVLNMYLTDESKAEIRISLWNDDADLHFDLNEVIIFRYAKKATYENHEDGGESRPEVVLNVQDRLTHIWRKPDNQAAADFQIAKELAMKEEGMDAD